MKVSHPNVSGIICLGSNFVTKTSGLDYLPIKSKNDYWQVKQNHQF
jgi:hypothetical protein